MDKWSGRQNNRSHPIRAADKDKFKKMNVWDLWDNIKHVKLHIIEVLEEERRESKMYLKKLGLGSLQL